jgi:hypothetical protein
MGCELKLPKNTLSKMGAVITGNGLKKTTRLAGVPLDHSLFHLFRTISFPFGPGQQT